MAGKLYIVATPIGNLEDITFRAVRILKQVDFIACEDTRHAVKLMSRYEINTRLTSYHEHNEKEKSEQLLYELLASSDIAVISDAGTPLISDPGFRLIHLAIENNIEVVSIPGPSSLLTALTSSGLPVDRFCYMGFPPRTEKKLGEFLAGIAQYSQTIVVFESARRTARTLRGILTNMGDRRIAICRELTKLHEEVLRGNVSELLDIIDNKDNLKGEVTLVIEGYRGNGEDSSSLNLKNVENRLKSLRKLGLSLKDAVKVANEDYEVQRNQIYEIALSIWDNNT